MALLKRHIDEVDTGVSLVRRLASMQFPLWADLPNKPVDFSGTDNALYRLGDHMVVRLPRVYCAVGQIEKEHRWLDGNDATIAPTRPQNGVAASLRTLARIAPHDNIKEGSIKLAPGCLP
jgi:hypothetical protein